MVPDTGSSLHCTGTTEAIVDGDALRLKNDKQPTKYLNLAGLTAAAETKQQPYLQFGMAMVNFSAVTSSLKKLIVLNGRAF